MKKYIRTTTILSSALASALVSAIAVTPAAAQNGIVNIPTPDKNIWTVVPTDKGAAFFHKKSKAICDSTMRDLTLVAIKDYTPDGTNSACQYEKTTADGLSRLTMYVYTAPGISGVNEYRSAKSQVLDYNRTTPVKVTEDKAESKNCFNATVARVGQAMLEQKAKNNPDGPDQTLQMGVVMFNMDFPKTAKQSAKSERSLLSVYQNDEWVVKMRVNVPAGETSSIDACRYAGLPNIALARQMD